MTRGASVGDLTMPGASDDRTLWRVTAWTSVISGVMAAVGIVFLTGMFTAFAMEATTTAQSLGRINDWLVLLSYLLCAPSVLAVWRLVRATAPALGALTLALGLGSIAGIVMLQWLLVTDVLTFEEQIGLATIAFLALGVWFVVTGHLGARAGVLPRGARLGLLAATYAGYPVWCVWLARRLRAQVASGGPVVTSPGIDRAEP
jgi:hypothetical protein